MVARPGLLGQEEAMLNVFEMAALRKIAGLKLIDKIRNETIRDKLGQQQTITFKQYTKDKHDG